MNTNEKDNAIEPTVRLVPIVHPEYETTAEFVNHMVVQRDESMVYCTLYQLHPPMVANEEEAKSLERVVVKPVSRIAIPLAKLDAFIDAFQNIRPQNKTSELDEKYN